MTLVRCQPMWRHSRIEGIAALQRHMNRLFDETSPTQGDRHPVEWSPRVDLTEFDDHYELTVELPGLSREEVKVEVENNILSLSGEKKSESEREDRNLYVGERNFGSFRRSFQFPSQIEPAKIEAQFKDGILTISLPKIETAKPMQVEIKVH